ncbi:hypothetical protein Nepgr_011047 [Nepenthes gracilis]|uniref:Uncharacterized protein n=1 Tax=Nepenthes gracilis TaxID=150966 RepID=A0AAD3XLL5_NEPGR|nr:hypothetical protein Nepgr_011047 [Nepenthes gracilis]
MNDTEKKRTRDEVEREYGAVAEEEDSQKKEKSAGVKRKTPNNPEEMVAWKDGYDDESKLLRTDFFGEPAIKDEEVSTAKRVCSEDEEGSVSPVLSDVYYQGRMKNFIGCSVASSSYNLGLKLSGLLDFLAQDWER